MKAGHRLVVLLSLALFVGGVALLGVGVGVATGQDGNEITNPTFNGLTGWTIYAGTPISHTTAYDHKGGDGSLVVGATTGRVDQTANLQMSGAHVLTLWIKGDDPDCRVQGCLADLCAYAAVGDDWRKVGVVGQFQAGDQNVSIQWDATGSCTATELYIDDVGLYYTPELAPTVYTLDDVYYVLDQMRQADETFYADAGFRLDEIHHDDYEARSLATTLTTTFQLDDGQSYQIATIGTYTDGERAMIACLIALVMLQVFQFLRKEIKG